MAPNKKNTKAFTIVELLIVIVVIAILAAIVIATYTGLRERAEGTALKSDLSNAAKFLSIDSVLNGGDYPASLAAASGGEGMSSSPNTTFEYSVDNSSSPATFCLSATSSSLGYHITQSGAPTEGVCTGHAGPSGGGGGGSETYSVGETGPADGVVIYDKGSSTNGWQYLEVAPSDQSTSAEWGCEGTSISGANGTAIGTGAQNTADILAGCAQAGIAARLADNYSHGGYSDWFLPSVDELELIYQRRADISGLNTNQYYWSSSEYNSYDATDLEMGGGTTYTNYKSDVWNVRAIRAFE